MLDHSDDLVKLGLFSHNSCEQTFTDGRFIRESHGRQLVIDDHYFSSIDVVLGCEGTALNYRSPQDLEISGHDEMHNALLKLVRIGERGFRPPARQTVAAVLRKRNRLGDAGHPLNFFETIAHPL